MYRAVMLKHAHSLLLGALACALTLAACGGGSGEETSTAPFEPQVSLRAIGGTMRTDKPTLAITVRARPGDANIRSVNVNLPPVVLVDTTAIDICSQKELADEDCAGHSPIGTARAVSPAFEAPLSGPVYVVSGSGRIPGLAYLLNGPEEVVLRGRVISKGGRMAALVDDIPNVPLRTFELRVDGGKDGDLVLSRDICHGDPVADAVLVSQDGSRYAQRVPLEADCGG